MPTNLRWPQRIRFLDLVPDNRARYLLCYIGANFGLMVSVNYKTYVKAEILDDKYLTLIGSFGAIACSLSRIIWGSILEK